MNARLFRLGLTAVLAALSLAVAGDGVASSRYAWLLRDSESRRKLRVLAVLEEKREAAGVLRTLATHENPLMRLRCAEVLGRIGEPSCIPYLKELMNDEDSLVVETAVYSLGLVGGSAVIEPLGECLAAKRERVKVRALEALGKVGSHNAALLIIPYLRAESPILRSAAAVSLALSGDSASAEVCLPLLRDEDPRVLASSAYAMGRLGYKGAVKELISFLHHESADVRLQAAEALGRLKGSEAIDALSGMLDDTDRMVRIKAVEALSRIATREAGTVLVSALESQDSYVRAVALQGIANVADPEAFDAAVALLDDGSLMVRRDAIRAAAATGGERARNHLHALLLVGSALEKKTVLEELGRLGGQAELSLLLEYLSSSEDALLREGAAEGLGKWPRVEELMTPFEGGGSAQAERPVDVLLKAADGEDWVVGSIALESLGKTVGARVLPELLRICTEHKAREDSDRTLVVLDFLGSLGRDTTLSEEDERNAVAFLSEMAKNADPRVADAGARAARSFGDTLRAAPSGTWERGTQPWGEPLFPLGQRRALLKTSRGDIEIVLFGDDAPNVVKSFMYLAESGFYDGLTFHRVVPGFVIQGGCPRGDGWGDAGYYLRDQFNLHRYERGFVGMAHSGKDTPGSQIFVTHTPQPHLNGRYTIIGKVTRGMDVVDRIEVGDTFSVKILE